MPEDGRTQIIIGATADLVPQHFKVGLQAQQRGEFGGNPDIIHRKDSFRECANFVRPAMSRIQSIACSNFAGRHPVPSVALSNKSDHRPLFRRSAHRQLSLQCGTNFRVCGSVRDEANRDQIAQNLFRGLSLWHWASALGMSLQPSIYRSRRAFLPVSKEGRNQCPLLGVKRTSA
jgi:hypothetical protein